MEELARERNLDDFLNELKAGTQRAGDTPPRNFTDQKNGYNSIQMQPDLVNSIEWLKLQVDKNTQRILTLEEEQNTFMGHMAELTNRMNGISDQDTSEVIQKVENFMSYFVAKVDEKIQVAEKKMEMERNRMVMETERRISQAPPAQSTQQHPSNQSSPESYRDHHSYQQEPHPQQRPSDVLNETNRKVEVLTDRIKLSDDLLIRYIDKQDKQYKKLKKGAVPKWLYWLNILLLAGILLFLIQHFFANYKIVVKPEVRSTQENLKPSMYAEQRPAPSPLLPVHRPSASKERKWGEAKRFRPSNKSVDYAYHAKPKFPDSPTKLKETTVYLAIDE